MCVAQTGILCSRVISSLVVKTLFVNKPDRINEEFSDHNMIGTDTVRPRLLCKRELISLQYKFYEFKNFASFYFSHETND